VRDLVQEPCPDEGTHHASDDQKQRHVEVDLWRPLAKVVDRYRRDRDRDDRDEGRRVGLVLGHLRPKHQQRHHRETAANPQQPPKKAAYETDRRETPPVDYSVVRGGVSGGFTTTEGGRTGTGRGG